jgi:hypothetical protein
VFEGGTLDVGNSKNVASATRLSTGRYCVVLSVFGRNAIATLGQSGLAIGVDAAFATPNCSSGIEVRTFDGDAILQDNDFNLNVN